LALLCCDWTICELFNGIVTVTAVCLPDWACDDEA
jgi:hypothetical protein